MPWPCRRVCCFELKFGIEKKLINYHMMSNRELLEEYSKAVKKLKKQWTDAGMSEEEFKELYFESLISIEKSNPAAAVPRQRFIPKYKILFMVAIAAILMVYNYKTIYSCTVCNMQEYIYPGLKLLRKISIPFISLFPALTDFYHETCLIENPFFTVVDMDCWPCSTVSNIMVITDPKPVTQQHTAPFMYETDQQVINLQSLRSLYVRNKDVFDKDSSQVLGNNKFYVNPSDMFNNLLTDDSNFYVWKFNNMNAAKVLRQVIPRPKVVPKFGQSTERFIIIDKSQKLFHIPETECSFSFLLSLSGSRTIDLVPAEECKHRCKTLRIELKDNYLLWYNWWYWRPRIQPSSGNATFIAHVGSYC